MQTIDFSLFHGEPESVATFGPIAIVRSKYRPNNFVPTHHHEGHCLFVVESGSMFQVMPDRLVVLKKGVVGFQTPELPHRNYSGPAGASIINVAIRSEWFTELGTDLLHRSAFWTGRAATKLRDLLVGKLPLSENTLHAIRDVMCNALSRDFDNQASDNELAEKAYHIVAENFAESISLGLVATELGVNSSHLGRVFRKNFGSSVGEFIKVLRLDLACQMLINSNHSISVTAYDCGFADQSELTRSMKNSIGWTPAAFRKTFQSSQ